MQMKYMGKNIFEYTIKTVILFSFIFDMSIISFVTTRLLACMCAMIYLILIGIPRKKPGMFLVNKRFFLPICGLIICAIICTINNIGLTKNAGNAYYEPHYFIYIILYIIIFSFWCAKVFYDVSDFACTYIPIMLFQSGIVFLAAVNTMFRLFIYNNFYFGDDRFDNTIRWGTRIMGIALHSSSGSLILCAACFLLVYLVLNKKLKTFPFMLMYIVIAVATAFIARTGFYIEIILLLAYMILFGTNFKKIIQVGIIVVLSILLFSLILSVINPVISTLLSQWVGEIFSTETRYDTIYIFTSMKIPSMSPEMILGTNVTFGVTPSGAIMESDSGYAKTYCAIGVVGAIIYYSSFLWLFFYDKKNTISKGNQMFFLVVTLTAFLIEIKEPYFQKYVFAWFILTLMMLSEKEKRREEIGTKIYENA